MRRWSYMLGGLMVWTLHFSGLYAIASLEAQTPADDATPWRGAAILFSVVCLAACLALAASGFHRAGKAPTAGAAFHDQLAAWGGVIAAIAVGWQALSTLVV